MSLQEILWETILDRMPIGVYESYGYMLNLLRLNLPHNSVQQMVLVVIQEATIHGLRLSMIGPHTT